MQNKTLVDDYLKRSVARLAAVDTLFEKESWADVVRESQEIVELTLKALLRASKIEVPRIHDVSQILEDQVALIPSALHADLGRIGKISRSLRRDRELAFYGSEDLTPSEFYKKKDAEEARESARWVVQVVSRGLGK